jgi:hypothetical protein
MKIETMLNQLLLNKGSLKEQQGSESLIQKDFLELQKRSLKKEIENNNTLGQKTALESLEMIKGKLSKISLNLDASYAHKILSQDAIETMSLQNLKLDVLKQETIKENQEALVDSYSLNKLKTHLKMTKNRE